jgi:hypothetical protein
MSEPHSESAAEHLISRGREIETVIRRQYERYCRAPQNREEDFRLGLLLSKWHELEKEAARLGVDLSKHFDASYLALASQPAVMRSPVSTRNVFCPVELAWSVRDARENKPARHEQPAGMWEGVPKGA